MDTLKERLKYVRNLREMSQKQVADKVPTSQSTINDLESGRIKSSGYMMRIADVLDVDLRWLTDGVGSPAGEGITIVNQGSPLPMYNWPDLATILTRPDQPPGLVDLIHKCPIQHSGQAYCLGVTQSQAIERIGAGEIIFVDPVCRYVDGAFVIVLLNNLCVLRQLVTDGIKSFIKTDNPALAEESRLIPVNLTALEPGTIEVPDTCEGGVDVVLAGRVIMREEIYI